jgi:hypothetical protein
MFDKRGITYHDTNADLFWGRDNVVVIQPRTAGFTVKRYFR